MAKPILKSKFDPRFSKPYEDTMPAGYEKFKVIGDSDDTEYILVAYRQCGGCGGKRHGADCSGLCQDCRAGKEPSAVPQQFQTRIRVGKFDMNGQEKGVQLPEAGEKKETQDIAVEVSAKFVDRVWLYLSDDTRDRAMKEVFPSLPVNVKTMIIEKAMELEGA